MIGLLEALDIVRLVLVLPRDVPSDRIVPRERSRTIRTWHPNALVALPYVSA